MKQLAAYLVNMNAIIKATHIRIDVKRLVLDQCFGHSHHLRQDKDIIQAVRNLLRDELHKVWHKLM